MDRPKRTPAKTPFDLTIFHDRTNERIRIDHGIKNPSRYFSIQNEIDMRERWSTSRHQSHSHFCSARAIPLMHMIYASRDSRAGKYRFIFTPSSAFLLLLYVPSQPRRGLLIPPISGSLLLRLRLRSSVLKRSRDHSLPFSIPRSRRSRRTGRKAPRRLRE